MTTLESRYKERVQALQSSRASPHEVSDAEVEYMLNAAPFIRQYTSLTAQTPAQKPRTATGIDNFVTVQHQSNKNHVYQNYLIEVEKNLEAAQAMPAHGMRANEDVMTCATCDKPYVFNQRESELVCLACGSTKTHMEMSEHNITYDQESQQNSIVSYFAYKRLNHFTEWLNSLQAKENTEIPEEVLEAVRAEFKKERASKRGDIKPSKVRAFLKKLKLNKVRWLCVLFFVAACSHWPHPFCTPACSTMKIATRLSMRSTACRRPSCLSTWKTASRECLARSRNRLNGIARRHARTSCHTRTCCTNSASCWARTPSCRISCCSKVAKNCTNKMSFGKASARTCNG